MLSDQHGKDNSTKETKWTPAPRRSTDPVHHEPDGIFHRNGKINPNDHIELQRIPTVQNSLEKEEQSGVITIAGFQLCHKVMVIKTLWYWHKHRTVKKKGIEEPRNKCLQT